MIWSLSGSEAGGDLVLIQTSLFLLCRYTRGSLLPQYAPATPSRSKATSSAPTTSSEKICCATNLLLPSFAPSYQTGLIWGSRLQGEICCTILFQEQAPSCVPKFALRQRVSGASSLVCTGWGTYPGACFGSVFQERVSGASSLVCTGLKSSCSNVNRVFLHDKGREVCIKARPTPASLSFKDQVTEETIVKWPAVKSYKAVILLKSAISTRKKIEKL